MTTRDEITTALDGFFSIAELGPDPAFSRFLPAAYGAAHYAWQENFEPAFGELFNGLMLSGAPTVETVFLSVFPTPEVLEAFLTAAQPGDLLFMHHPLDMQCGDPRGAWGAGFVPIAPDLLKRIRERQLSVYTVHLPLDYNPHINTSLSVAKRLGIENPEPFLRFGDKATGLVGEVPSQSSTELAETLQKICDIPYTDVQGQDHAQLAKVAVLAGMADKPDHMAAAEARGVQAYISGEIVGRIDNEVGRRRFAETSAYINQSGMTFIGTSHAASEFVVMHDMADWFSTQFDVQTSLLPLEKWWR